MTENRRVKKAVAAIAVLFVVVFAFSVAGCGRRYYDEAKGGRSNEDLYLINDDNSVDLLRKKLVYTLDDFDEQSADKKSELTVTYDMFNPNSEDITRKFALLCDRPSYVGESSSRAKDFSVAYEGKKVNFPTRYVYCSENDYTYYRDERKLSVADLQTKVSDEYKRTDRFTPETPVTAYTFEVEYDSIEPRGYILFDANQCVADKFLVENVTHPEYLPNSFSRMPVGGTYGKYIGLTAHNGDTVKVHVIEEVPPEETEPEETEPEETEPEETEPEETEPGEDGTETKDEPIARAMSRSFEWHIYSDKNCEQSRGGKVNKTATDEITFTDLVMLGYDDYRYMSSVDFYNATVAYWSDCGTYGILNKADRLREKDLASMLLGEITIPAKTLVTLTVSQPVVRATNADQYDVPVYTYKFNYHNANWNYVGEFVLEINSPYYVLDINSGLTQKDGGVYLAEDGFYKDIEFAIAPKQEALTQSERHSRIEKQIYANMPFYMMFGTAAALIGKSFIAANGIWGAVLWLVAVAVVAAIFLTLHVLNYKKRKRALSAAQSTEPQSDANRNSEEDDHSEKAD